MTSCTTTSTSTYCFFLQVVVKFLHMPEFPTGPAGGDANVFATTARMALQHLQVRDQHHANASQAMNSGMSIAYELRLMREGRCNGANLWVDWCTCRESEPNSPACQELYA